LSLEVLVSPFGFSSHLVSSRNRLWGMRTCVVFDNAHDRCESKRRFIKVLEKIANDEKRDESI
jgi:hypothetical protein